MASETSNAVPNPGSIEAQLRGCTCPVIDNHHGAGVPTHEGRQFWITAGCPIHGVLRAAIDSEWRDAIAAAPRVLTGGDDRAD